MSDLSKWLPFKFDRRSGRKKNESKDTQVARQNTSTDPFDRLNHEMNQMMRGFFGGDDWFLPTFRSVSQAPSWFGDFRPNKFTPHIDVADTENHLIVSAEVPGLSKDDLDVTVHEGTLNIKGEKRHEFENDENGVYRTERFFGTFQRTVPLPADIDANGAESRFEDGVLTLKLPKVAREKDAPKRIDI